MKDSHSEVKLHDHSLTQAIILQENVIKNSISQNSELDAGNIVLLEMQWSRKFNLVTILRYGGIALLNMSH